MSAARARGRGFWLLYGGGLLLLTLAVLELGLRALWIKRATVSSGLEHPHFHHRQLPNHTYRYTTAEFDVTIRTNSYGLRGPDPVIPKPSGVTRLVMLGDSYVFGFPVADTETFAARIEQMLRGSGHRVEVVNGGVSGYSPTLEYVSLRDQFLAFEPDAVLLWYDLGDLQEDSWFQKNLLYDADGRIVRADPRFINGRFGYWEWLKNHSALAKYADIKLLRTFEKIRVLGLPGYLRTKLRGERAKVAIARLKRTQQAADAGAHDRFFLVRESATEELIRPYWDVSRRYVLMIRDLCAERGIRFAMGVYPYGMLVGPDQWATGRRFWGFEPGRTYDANAVRGLYRAFAAQEHIPLIDTFDSFRAAAASTKLFYDEDGHFTPEGHRVLAEHAVRDLQLLALIGADARARRSPWAFFRRSPRSGVEQHP